MKKIFLTFICAIISSLHVLAQSTATLTHGDKTTLFYGEDAFMSACDAAEDGDVITLSTGAFNTSEMFNISKSLTIRGTGNFWTDDITQKSYIRTYYSGIYISGQHVIFEGVDVNRIIMDNGCQSLDIVKCHIDAGSYNTDNPSGKQVRFSQSKVGWLYFSGALVSNSVINRVETGDCIFDHCLINSCFGSSNVYNNCFIIVSYESIGDNTFNYCAFYPDLVEECGLAATHNVDIHNFDCFNNPDGVYDAYPDYTLTPEAQATYIGSDGTQIGIYGGATPFSTALRYPNISKFQVDYKSTTDGKLGVNIEVQMPE